MPVDYRELHDPNAEYTMRDLSTEAMQLRAKRGGGRDVTITDVQTTMVDGTFPWTLVRVYTDAGIVGTGEAYWGAGVPELIERMVPMLIGENPLDIDRLYRHLIQRMSGEGSIEGVTVTAISGIEIALHDLVGRILDVPVYQLLGGKYRDAVRVYNDCHTTDEADPDACAREATRVVDELGYDAIKFDLDVPSGTPADRANRHLSPQAIEHKRAIVAAVTDAVGDRADVAFDCHWSYTRSAATQLLRALAPYPVWWIEDPIPPENTDAQAQVTAASAVPIAAGENRYRVREHERLLRTGAVDIIAPDLPKVGGLRETRRIADVADMHATPVALHNVASPVATMAAVHLGAAIPNLLAVEFHSYQLGWWADLIGGSVIDGGHIPVPEGPGLGVTLDMDVVDAHRVPGSVLFDAA